MEQNPPIGTALIVYVGEDGNIIDMIEPATLETPKLAADVGQTLSAAKFSITYPTPSSGNLMAKTVYCCWRKINGIWYCRPEYC
jgi:hypothetical protein